MPLGSRVFECKYFPSIQYPETDTRWLLIYHECKGMKSTIATNQMAVLDTKKSEILILHSVWKWSYTFEYPHKIMNCGSFEFLNILEWPSRDQVPFFSLKYFGTSPSIIIFFMNINVLYLIICLTLRQFNTFITFQLNL